MANQDGRHWDIVAQFLGHVMSSPFDADLKGDITYYPPSKFFCHYSFNILSVT